MVKINKRKDILLLLFYSPGLMDSPNEPISGRTRLIKMLFLFKEELLPTLRKGGNIEVTQDNFYEFIPWDFGPFSTEIYDDINFFLLHNFIKVSDISTGNPLPESAAEWNKWLSSIDNNPESDEATEYQEEVFSLTKRGVDFTSGLFEELSLNQKTTLKLFKEKLMKASLRSVLRYVYKNYSDYTVNSKIREDVLNDYMG